MAIYNRLGFSLECPWLRLKPGTCVTLRQLFPPIPVTKSPRWADYSTRRKLSSTGSLSSGVQHVQTRSHATAPATRDRRHSGSVRASGLAQHVGLFFLVARETQVLRIHRAAPGTEAQHHVEVHACSECLLETSPAHLDLPKPGRVECLAAPIRCRSTKTSPGV